LPWLPVVAAEAEAAITAMVEAIKAHRATLAQLTEAMVPAWAVQTAVVAVVAAAAKTEEQGVQWILAMTMVDMLAKTAFV
jgi:hypothetical protein